MISKRVSVARELFAAVTVDAVAGAITVILGTAGGIDVETVAKERPEALFRKTVVPPGELRGHDARAWRARPGSGVISWSRSRMSWCLCIAPSESTMP